MKRFFSLSPRLQTVADLVPHGKACADIGTDHGRLPVWLLHHKRIPFAVATDLRPKPLACAKSLAAQWEISESQISFRLCDGLTGVHPEEAQTITITGMGGETIADILDASSWVKEPRRCYILQAMSGTEGLRRYLSENGFSIRIECLVEENGVIYIVLVAEYEQDLPWSPGVIWVGRQSSELQSPLRSRYLNQELTKLRCAISGLEHSKQPEDFAKKKMYELAAQEISQMKKEWDMWQP